MQMSQLSTEFLYHGVKGGIPTGSPQVAYKTAGAEPEEADWHTAVLVDPDAEPASPLLEDAQSSGVQGDYWLARLIGPFGTNDVVLTPADYQPWGRWEDTDERPVRVFPETLTITGSAS